MTAPARAATNTLLDAGCGSEDLEGSHHVQRGEPGVEQVGDLHDFSVWPRRHGHKDTSLTMSATASAAYRRHMDSQMTGAMTPPLDRAESRGAASSETS